MMDELDKRPWLIPVMVGLLLVSSLLVGTVPGAELVFTLTFLALAALLLRRWSRAAISRSHQAPSPQREPQPFTPEPPAPAQPAPAQPAPAPLRSGEKCPWDHQKIVFATQAEAQEHVRSSRDIFVPGGKFEQPLDHEYYCKHGGHWHVSSQPRRGW
jgi:hypothetical protein